MEKTYCNEILKKNEKDIKKITSQIGSHFTEAEAARQIVEKIFKKAPFPSSYQVTVILKMIREKAI